MLKEKKSAQVLLSFLLLGVIVAFDAAAPDFLKSARLQVFDFYQKLKPRLPSSSPVIIADIDDESLARWGQWPWPRTLVADLIRRLDESGASTVALDILFAEPDRIKPKDPAAPDNDRTLAAAIARARTITSFGLLAKKNGISPALKSHFAFAGDDPRQFLLPLDGAVVNLPEIEAAAAGNGSFNMARGDGGILRHVPLLYLHRDTLYPSLSLETLRLYVNAGHCVVRSSGASSETSFGERTGISAVQCGRFSVPTDSTGRVWLYDSGHAPGRYLPAWRILSGEYDPALVRDKIVLIGISAVGLKDIRATPLEPLVPGPEIHAQILEQMLDGRFLYRPDWAQGAELVYLVLLGSALIFLMAFANALIGAVIGISFITFAFGFSWYAFSGGGWLLDPVYPAATLLAVYLCSSLIQYLNTEKERRSIRNAFSRYISPELVDVLIKHPEKLRLGGETKEITVLFADIRGFTGLSEKMEAEELISFINHVFTPITNIIQKYSGTVDKYMGDCVMAFWNAPLDVPGHPRLALQAAREIIEYFKSKEIKLGIGINTGPCSVGNMGSESRFDYSVIGDAVNLAARLQELTKIYDAAIILGGDCAKHVENEALRDLGSANVRGRDKPVRVYGA